MMISERVKSYQQENKNPFQLGVCRKLQYKYYEIKAHKETITK